MYRGERFQHVAREFDHKGGQQCARDLRLDVTHGVMVYGATVRTRALAKATM